MSGVSYWRTSAPSHVLRSLRILERSSAFSLVPQDDSAKYLVKTNFKGFRLLIGNPHKCECKKEQPCIHVLFVLTQHLKLPYTSDLLFQEGLNEIILTNLIQEVQPEIKEYNSCVFCKEQENLVECKDCRKKFHWICLELASKVRNSTLACPGCNSTVRKEDYSLKNSCSHCKMILDKAFYRCLFCITQDFFLCQNCYTDKKIHRFHPFVFEGCWARRFNDKESHRNVLASLQYREINPEDYQALLLLDEGGKTSPMSFEKFLSLERRLCSSLEMNSCCPICLERFVEEECIALPCGHVLHIECGKNWLTTYKDECPVDHIKVCTFRD